MRKFLITVVGVLLVLSTVTVNAASAPKKWTFILFLNGNNNLDFFGKRNILAMEKIGSSDEVNVVVQWASYKKKKAVRMLIQKSDNPNKVTSPVVQDLGLVDMGNYRALEDFIDWSVKSYPADHYFVAVWNHGSGWKKRQLMTTARDISYDELSGNHITTEQLGYVMAHAAHTMGHKVDIYGSDACLMGMAEVANEMSNDVQFFAGSQDLEPGDGWPYEAFLKDWTSQKDASPQFVLNSLVNRYVEHYSNESGITFSAYDLGQLANLNQAMSILSAAIEQFGPKSRNQLVLAARNAESFFYSDYVDLVHLMQILLGSSIDEIDYYMVKSVLEAAQSVVIANKATTEHANGLSVWLPLNRYAYNKFVGRYKGLRFSQQTGWIKALGALNQA